MKEKIFESLKTKYAQFGFSEKALTGVAEYLAATVTEEQGVEPAVNGAETLLKAFQGDIDRRVTEAVNKVKTEQRKPDNPEPPKPTEEIPEWAKSLAERMESFERRTSQERMAQQLHARLADRVPEAYLKGRAINITSEDEIDQLASRIEGEFTALKQEMVNQGVFVEAPKKPQAPGQEGVDLARRIAEQRNKGLSEGVEGKKI